MRTPPPLPDPRAAHPPASIAVSPRWLHSSRNGRNSRSIAGTLLALLLSPLLAACDGYPRDAEGSTRRAGQDGLRVGVSHDPPHVVVDGEDEPSGDDIDRIRAFASARGAHIEWVVLGHDHLMEELVAFRLHLVAGGHARETPWQPQVSWSRTFAVRDEAGALTQRRFALPPGENAWQLEVDRFLLQHDEAAGANGAGTAP